MAKDPVVLKIDYAKVRTKLHVIEWARKEFALPDLSIDNPGNALKAIFESLARRGETYRVIEYNSSDITPEVNRLLNGFGNVEDGWKLVLSFHLFREGTNAHVAFEKRRWWSRQ